MITVKKYLEWYKKEEHGSGDCKIKPEFLFKLFGSNPEDYVFNPDNWNGGDILRRGLMEILASDNYTGLPEIKYYYIEDRHTFFIFTYQDWYEISWLEFRGCTDRIKMNGEPILLYDYINLCNILNITLERES